MLFEDSLLIISAVNEDIRCHRDNGVDLNPYSTNRARASWKNGFDGKPATLLDWHEEYQRGKVAAQIMIHSQLYENTY